MSVPWGCYICNPTSQVVAKLDIAVDNVDRDEVAVTIGVLAIVEEHPVERFGEKPNFDVKTPANVFHGWQLDKGLATKIRNSRIQ